MSLLIDGSPSQLQVYSPLKLQVTCKKTSSVQGIVRPPIGWSYPNSSSAQLSKYWNEVWFKYDVGITNRFISSPTYTARYPFGTFATFNDVWLLLNVALLIAAGKRKPILNVSKNKLKLSNLRKKNLSFDYWVCEWLVMVVKKSSVFIVFKSFFKSISLINYC